MATCEPRRLLYRTFPCSLFIRVSPREDAALECDLIKVTADYISLLQARYQRYIRQRKPSDEDHTRVNRDHRTVARVKLLAVSGPYEKRNELHYSWY